VRLEPLYTLRFQYPEGWGVALTGAKGTEEHDFYFPEGRAEGRISGSFRGSNHPRRRTDETYELEIHGFLQTDDGATILLEYRGYGRSRARSDELYANAGVASDATKYRRQVVGFARHVTDHPQYRWLNDAVCAIAGEVRAPPAATGTPIRQADVRLVFRVDELVWDAPPE